MATGFKFEDNSGAVKSALQQAIEQCLTDIGNELVSQIHRSYDKTGAVDTGHTKGSYRAELEVGKDEISVQVGSDNINAIWEEFGTGTFAEEGGRQGFWVYVDDGSTPEESVGGQSYTLEKAKQIVAIMRSKGLNAYYTNGKKPRRHVRNSYEQNKNKFIKHAQEQIGVKLNEL